MNILTEGGNVFADVSPIKKEFVPGIIKEIQRLMPKGVTIIPHIGSAGFKVQSGDMDVFIDEMQLLQALGIDSDPLDTKLHTKKVRLAKDTLSKILNDKQLATSLSGRNVHVRMPVPDGTFVQVDLMIIENAKQVAQFHQHGLTKQYDDPGFKGGQLFILYASLAKALGLKFSPFEGKLVDRETNKVIATDKDKIAKILLNPNATANDLNNIKSIMKALENDPKKTEKLAQAKVDASKGLIVLPESIQIGSSFWFRNLMNNTGLTEHTITSKTKQIHWLSQETTYRKLKINESLEDEDEEAIRTYEDFISLYSTLPGDLKIGDEIYLAHLQCRPMARSIVVEYTDTPVKFDGFEGSHILLIGPNWQFKLIIASDRSGSDSDAPLLMNTVVYLTAKELEQFKLMLTLKFKGTRSWRVIENLLRS